MIPSARPTAHNSRYDKLFDTRHLKSELKSRAVRGSVVSLGAQWATYMLHIVATVILARLLTPQDFGLIAMVMVITGFVERFKDIGLSVATIQKPEINHDQISTLFWINLSISLAVALITAALAPVIAWFYGEPRLSWITVALASGIVFGGLAIQHQALLRRQMCFRSLAIMNVISMVAGVLAGVISAFCGLRYWALVIMYVAQPATRVAMVWAVCSWRPGLPVRRSGVRAMLIFGGHYAGFELINYFARNVDNLLIGRFWGAGQLGIYGKAYSLLLLPIGQIKTPIGAVAIPALSRLQDDPNGYRRYYYRAMSVIAFITMPFVAMLAASSEEVVAIILGKQWAESAIIFKILALAAFFQPLWTALSWVFVSLGQTKRMMRWGMAMVPIIVLSFVIGLPWGAIGVATSYTVCFLALILVPSFWYAYRFSPVDLSGLWKAIRYPFVLSICVYAGTELSRHLITADGALLCLVYSCTLGFLVLLLGIALWPGAKREAGEILRTAKLLRRPGLA